MLKKLLILPALCLVAACSGTGPDSARNLTLCGASPSGLWSLLGAGIDAAMKQSFPGSTVTYQTSGGGFANVRGLQAGRCELALVHDAEIKIAANGEPPFTAAHDNLRTIAVLYSWAPLQLVVSRDFAERYGVESLEDIVAKKAPVRLLLNRRGNISSQVGEAMIQAAGASLDDIAGWGGSVTYAASEEQGDLMRDRRADALLNSLFVGHSSLLQVADALDVVLLPISRGTATAVAERYGVRTFTIPGGAYPWSSADVLTVALSAHLIALDSLPGEIAGDVAAALAANIDRLKSVHSAMKPLDLGLMMSSTTVPYHQAALRAYSAAGNTQASGGAGG